MKKTCVAIRDFCIWPRSHCAHLLAEDHPQQVLFVRFDELGDLLIWLPYARANLKLLPQHKATLAVNHLWADFAHKTGIFDEIIPVYVRKFRRNPIYRRHIKAKIGSRKWDVIIHPCRTRWQRFADAENLIASCQANHIIGFSNPLEGGWRSRMAAPIYSQLIAPVPAPQTPEWHQYETFLAGQGGPAPGMLPPMLATSFPTPAHFNQTPPYFVFAPGAGHLKRCWPIKNFASIAARLKNRGFTRIIICGAPQDAPVAASLANEMNDLAENWTGRTSVNELAGMIQHAICVLTNESAPAHLAAAVATPCICITGGGHFNRFMPYPESMHMKSARPVAVHKKMPCYNCNWRCIYKIQQHEATPCVQAVTDDDVWRAMESELSCLKN